MGELVSVRTRVCITSESAPLCLLYAEVPDGNPVPKGLLAFPLARLSPPPPTVRIPDSPAHCILAYLSPARMSVHTPRRATTPTSPALGIVPFTSVSIQNAIFLSYLGQRLPPVPLRDVILYVYYSQRLSSQSVSHPRISSHLVDLFYSFFF